MKTLLCIPTLNAANHAASLLNSIRCQKFQPDRVVVVDSGSSDGSLELFKSAPGVQVVEIPAGQFNHGGTRQMVVNDAPQVEIILFLTQDAMLAGKDDFERLLDCFQDENVGAAYGRHLPRENAGVVETHARLYNYPEQSRVRSAADIPEMGIKAAFFSNSFAAYRRSALQAVGGFPDNVILGEDTCVAARMLLQGWKVAYCAEARVFHSHDYSLLQEFRRYFDIGVFHGRESWLRRKFGAPSSEGVRFIKSEWAYLRGERPLLIPVALTRNALKLFGFRLGLLEKYLPTWLKRELSLHTRYWD